AVAASPLGVGMAEGPGGVAVVRSELGGREVVDDAVGIEQALFGRKEAVLLLRRVLVSQGRFEVAQLEDVLWLGDPVHDRRVVTDRAGGVAPSRLHLRLAFEGWAIAGISGDSGVVLPGRLGQVPGVEGQLAEVVAAEGRVGGREGAVQGILEGADRTGGAPVDLPVVGGPRERVDARL